MKIKSDAEIARMLNEIDRSCYSCKHFGRECENNDVRCNCRNSRYYLDVPPGEPCNHWKAKE